MASSTKKTITQRLFRSLFYAFKGEIEEIASLRPTDDDRKQGERLALMATSIAAGVGITVAPALTPIIAKVFAYGIRDMKDGITNNDKLIIERIQKELKYEFSNDEQFSKLLKPDK